MKFPVWTPLLQKCFPLNEVTILKKTLLIPVFLILYFTLCYQSAFAFNDTIHFDSDGSVIDKVHYVIIASEREKAITELLKNGYAIQSVVWKDPIRLRKKRIMQWGAMRLRYSRESLPENIEKLPAMTSAYAN